MKKLAVILMILFVGILIAGCTQTPAAPATPAPTAVPTAAPTPAPVEKNIIDTLVADGRFTTLVSALQAAKLDETLKGSGPYTLLAPTDDAFKNLPAGTLDTLLKSPEGDLKQTLLNHVVSGLLTSADAAKITTTKTLKGDSITLSVENEIVKINNGAAKVVTKDIKTSNGMIQVIDSVILVPVKPVATPTPTATPLPDYKIKLAKTLTFEPTVISFPAGTKAIFWTDALGYQFQVSVIGQTQGINVLSPVITTQNSWSYVFPIKGTYVISETLRPQFRDKKVVVTVT
jgi:uncharacterized surface protein with fasciclin (FAS1) repeats